MGKAKSVLLISNSYPDKNSPEKVFILPEVRQLVASGFRVTLMPARKVLNIDPELPDNVSTSDLLSSAYRSPNLVIRFLGLFKAAEFWHEIGSKPYYLFRLRFWKESVRASVIYSLFKKRKRTYDLFYTYWFTGETVGLVWAGVAPLISRAHGYDLYHSVNGGSIPYRYAVIDRLDKVIVLSKQAQEYLLDQYSIGQHRILVSPLGVTCQEPRQRTVEGQSQEIVFLSCSYSGALKRLPLIAIFICLFAKNNIDLTVRWIHIGAGLKVLEVPKESEQLENLSIDALGPRSNDYILNFYRLNEVSFFINLSSSEGMPVSIMEAMSFGVPVLATAVGGVPEMLHFGGGLLMDKDVNIGEAVKQVANLYRDNTKYQEAGKKAIFVQRKYFDAKKNHKVFADELLKLGAT